MPADALLVIPPLLKHAGGPLLGPAMLTAAAQAAGHGTRVLDLATAWLLAVDPTILATPPTPFVGDHDRPAARLRAAQARFHAIASPLLPPPPHTMPEDPVLTLPYEHKIVLDAAHGLLDTPWGAWLRAQLIREPRPDLVGISALYSGQVLWGLAIVTLFREIWPGVPVVWGGAHITALQDAIAADPRFQEAGDGFVIGHAEGSWVDLLTAVEHGEPWPETVLRPGTGRTPRARSFPSLTPAFHAAGLDGRPHLTLPAQTSRGCAYGRCRYCTYPAIEGGFRRLDADAWLPVVEQAAARGARVSFKDSLMVPRQLDEVAAQVAGRVAWSACTKLHPRLDAGFLSRLASAGLATLELGIETLSPQGQMVIDKRQSPALLDQLLRAAERSGISLVVNTITGFPGVDPTKAAAWQRRAGSALASHPQLHAKLEHNRFQLERLSPLGREPAQHGLEIVGAWPWSSVLAWRPRAARLPAAVA